MGEAASQVLEALRAAGGGRCSGEDLSTRLGVSRAQVWKHVGMLRARGYSIDGEPGGGYRLTAVPDRLYPEEIQSGLTTAWLGREIHHFDSTDSTNRVALELAQQGAGHGAAVVAEAQTAGRGRLGRRFYSPAYRNLYTSLVLRPALTTTAAPTLILAAGIAVAETVAATLEDEETVEIKWPNDVLLDWPEDFGHPDGDERRGHSRVELRGDGDRGQSQCRAPRAFARRLSRQLATSLRTHCRPARSTASTFARRLYGILESVLDDHARGGFAALRRPLRRTLQHAGPGASRCWSWDGRQDARDRGPVHRRRRRTRALASGTGARWFASSQETWSGSGASRQHEIEGA